MVDIQKMRGLKQEAKFMKEQTFDLRLVEVYSGQREGTPAEIVRLDALRAELGERIYAEAVYVLTHQVMPATEAKKAYGEIIDHRRRLSNALRRKVSVQVAALDYLQNVLRVLRQPTIIDEKKAIDFAGYSITDETTKAYDAELLASDVDEEADKCAKSGEKFSIVLLDVDDLKKINDSYGHLMGNKILEYLTEIVRRNLRKTDSIYRFGGDEFVVLMPGAGTKIAKDWAMRLRRTLSRLRTDGNLPPEVSLGVATFGTSGIHDRQTLMYAADRAMHAAKRSGKDRVSVYDRRGPIERDPLTFEEEKAPAPEKKRFEAGGVTVAPGLAIGTVFHYRDIMSSELDVRDIGPNDVKSEIKRVKSAMHAVRADLERMKKTVRREISPKHAAIFDVQQTILDEPDLLKEIENELQDRLTNAEQVVRDVFRRWEKKLQSSDSETMRERASDIADVARSILSVLIGVNVSILSDIPEGSVIFAKRLLPSDTVHLNTKRTRALVTSEGGQSSHSAILSKGMEVPSLSKIQTRLDRIPAGATVIVDGEKGRIVVNPEAGEIRKFETRIRGQKREMARLIAAAGTRRATKAGFTVRANVASAADVRLSREYGADGIGLYRIEQLYMMTKTLPTEEHLYRELAKTLAPMKAKPITVRLLDIGGDKTLPYLDIADKDSLLGLRGVRLLLKYPTLLETQIDALLRLSASMKVRVLVPMVSLAREMKEVRDALDREKEKFRKKGEPFDEKIALGAMIETPSAVLTVDEILKCSDFLSIGTNDLVQYTMVADREKLSVASYYEEGGRVILPCLRDVAAKSAAAGIECEICGELGGDLEFTSSLVAAGIRHFSVAPPMIPRVRAALSKLKSVKK